MASGLVRSAISGISERPKCQVKSARVTSIVSDAELLLKTISEPENIDHFDSFSHELLTKMEECFDAKKPLNRERVWIAFHKLRTGDLLQMWAKLVSDLKFKTCDPLLPQLACQALLEDMIKTKFRSEDGSRRKERESLQKMKKML